MHDVQTECRVTSCCHLRWLTEHYKTNAVILTDDFSDNFPNSTPRILPTQSWHREVLSPLVMNTDFMIQYIKVLILLPALLVNLL